MLNIAIMGCGVISKRHAELLGSNRIAGARLSAVCDTDKEKAEFLGNKFNVPAYYSMNNLMQKESIDVLNAYNAAASTVLKEFRGFLRKLNHGGIVLKKLRSLKRLLAEKQRLLGRLEQRIERIGNG